MDTKAAKQIIDKVEKDYNTIAQGFSQTRTHPWPEFELFKNYLKPNIKLLDLGCGNGRLLTFLTPYINKLGINYLGIDISENLLQEAQKNFPNQTFLKGNQIEINLPDKSIDQIWSIAAFHHIPSKKLRLQSLQEMNRILEKNGLLIITVWNLYQKKYRKYLWQGVVNWFKTFGKMEFNDLFIPWSKTGINRYYHAFTYNELAKLLHKNGFTIIEYFGAQKGEKVSFFKAHNLCFICRKQ